VRFHPVEILLSMVIKLGVTLLHGSAGPTSGPSSVEDHPSFRERDFAVAGQDYRRPVNLGERQIRLGSPRWRTLPHP
jgi:hypothetical protein